MIGTNQKQVQLKAALTGLAQLTPAKRLGLLLGLAACLALIFYFLYWTDNNGSVLEQFAQSSMQVSSPGTAQPATGKNASAIDTTPIRPQFASRYFERLIFGGLLGILFLLGVFRPVMRELARLPPACQAKTETPENPVKENLNLAPSWETAANERIEDYSTCLDNVRSMVRDNPKRVAQLLKVWINENSTNRY